MKYRKLGHGLKVSAIGIGCMPMIKGGNILYGEAADLDESTRAIHRAIDLGVTFFDTAQIYRPLQQRGTARRGDQGQARRSGDCDQVRVPVRRSGRSSASTARRPTHGLRAKARSSGSASIRSTFSTSTASTLRCRSRKTVGRNDGAGERGQGPPHRALRSRRRYHPPRRQEAAPITALQSEYSIWERDIEDEILGACRDNGIGFVPYSPLGRGFLSRARCGSRDELPENDWRRNDPRYSDENLPANLAIVDAIGAVADKHGVSKAQVALAWLLAQGDDIVPIPGTKRRATMEDSVGAADVTLTAEDLAAIDAAAPREGRHERAALRRDGDADGAVVRGPSNVRIRPGAAVDDPPRGEAMGR